MGEAREVISSVSLVEERRETDRDVIKICWSPTAIDAPRQPDISIVSLLGECGMTNRGAIKKLGSPTTVDAPIRAATLVKMGWDHMRS